MRQYHGEGLMAESTKKRRHEMPFGAEVTPDGCRFRLWAPGVSDVTLCFEAPTPRREIDCRTDAQGWVEVVVKDIGQGARYRWILPDGTRVPDPASRFQPEDVHGPSEVIDPNGFDWTDNDWAGRPWEDVVLYELHVGTFTPTGRFDAIIAKLDYLVTLGITAVELMPVNDFPGDRNWGYDGVCLFAPDSRYGHPNDLKALVDACHARGLMVFLDVVYNHFGPEGNYLYAYAKDQFFDASRHTPWGAAIAFDGPDGATVSDFFIHNALYWISEFHIDGLRLDAVHAIVDQRDPDVLSQIAEAVQALRILENRQIHLVLENDDNAARRLEKGSRGYTAQWNDDAHHVLHCLLTGERGGYYGDYSENSAGRLARICAEGFAYQGEASPHREGVLRGTPSAHLPATRFVNFLQNHDQIGNRAMGERIDALTSPEAVMAAHSVLFLMPSIPLLFQGEEWGARTPFLFFCDYGEDLHDAVRDGRRSEFESFPEFRDPEARARIPDPVDPQTYYKSMLDWQELDQPAQRDRLAFTTALLTLRKAEIVPLLPRLQAGQSEAKLVSGTLISARWPLEGGGQLSLLANMGGAPVTSDAPPSGRDIWAYRAVGAPDGQVRPWSVSWTLETPS
jgi:1,4-alpha-glucan branching enzyme/maltooligosyltrehalose trehalohydrolase